MKTVLPVLLLSSLLLSTQSVLAEQSTELEGSQSTELEEIIVTATRQGETLLQKTPITITSFSSEALDNFNAFSISELSALTPNTVFNYWGTGKLSAYIRGVGAQIMNWGEDARIGFYLDGVYLDKGMAANTSFFDVERIEVLRGPQGTLYGRNTIGGAVNIVTKKPSDELEMVAGVEVGNYNKRRLDATISGPLVEDKVKARIAFSRSTHDGYLKNLSGPDIFDEDYTGVRGMLDWALTDKVDVTLRADYYNADPRGFNNRLMTDTGLMAARAAAAGIPRSTYLPDDFWTTSQDREALNKLKLWGVSAHIGFDITENLFLRSITAYRDTFNYIISDVDSTAAKTAESDNWADYYQFSQELQLNGSTDRWNWMVGFFYFYLDEKRKGRNTWHFIFPGLQQVVDSGNTDETWAVYGDATFDITNQLSIQAGLRFTYEEKGGWFERWGEPDFPPFDRSLPNDKRDWNDWSPKIGLNYQLTEKAMLYGLVSKGFKSGFKVPSNPLTVLWVDPETLWNYEIGFKTEWYDNRLRVNGAFFYYDYTDMQVRTFVIIPPSPGTGVTQNAGKSEIKGVELEIMARPVESLTLSGSISYLDAKYKEFLAAKGRTPVDVAGNPLPFTPKWKLVFVGQYEIPIQGYGFLRIGGNLTWTDDQYFDQFKIPLNGQKAYTLIDAFARFETRDGHWSFEVYGKNLTETEYTMSNLDIIGDSVAYIGAPRTFGFQAIYRY